MIYWFTGQPGHGKTVLATALQHELDNAFHIDGDDIREIFNNKDYSEIGRRKNIDLAQHLAHFLHNKGQNVIVSLVSPYRVQRESFKQKLGDSIKEFYVFTTELRGRENFHVANYEPPLDNFMLIDTTNITVEELALSSVKNLGYKPTPENLDNAEDHLIASMGSNDKLPEDKALVKEL